MRGPVITLSILAASLAAADTIVIDGKRYEDVLVYSSDRLYYVVVPSEGIIINAYRDEVDPASVSIVRERSYRERLREIYEQNRELAVSRLPEPVAPPRPEPAAMEIESDTEMGGFDMPAMPDPGFDDTFSVPGLGVSANDLQMAVQGLGITLQQGPGGTLSGASPQAPITISASGPAENLTMISGAVTVPADQIMQLQTYLMQLQAPLAAAAPWLPEWIMGQQQQLMTTGSAMETRDGVTAQVSAARGPDTVSLNIALQATG